MSKLGIRWLLGAEPLDDPESASWAHLQWVRFNHWWLGKLVRRMNVRA